MENKIEKLLHTDPLVEAEKITGKSYKDDQGTVALGMAIQIKLSVAKKDALTASRDTHFSMDTDDYVATVQEEGFVEVYRKNVNDPERPGNQHFIFWHPDGILLTFDTYWNNKSINGGKFHYAWEPDGETKFYGVLSSGSFKKIHEGKLVWVGDHDCREAVRFHLSNLRLHGKFVKPWPEISFLWLLNYMDTKTEGYDHDAITRARLAELPQEVQDCITIKPR